MSTTLPPVERGQASMTRRHYLVERNRARRAKFEPTRQAIEAEQIRIAEERAKEKQERVAAWKASSTALANSSSGKHRPLPGGGPHKYDGPNAEERPKSVYVLEKEENARKKAEYRALYEADMREQIKLHQQTVKETNEREARQIEGLNTLNAEAAQRAADENYRFQEETKEYLARMQATNERERNNRIRRAKEEERKDLELLRLVQENARHRAEMDDRIKKNMNRHQTMMNEESYKAATTRRDSRRQREERELADAIERDRRAAEEDQAAADAKKERFRREFDEAVARDAEFRRTHNYDEPAHITRQRNELAAQTHRLMMQEQALRKAQQKAEYERELMDQIIARQDYAMTHLDEV